MTLCPLRKPFQIDAWRWPIFSFFFQFSWGVTTEPPVKTPPWRPQRATWRVTSRPSAMADPLQHLTASSISLRKHRRIFTTLVWVSTSEITWRLRLMPPRRILIERTKFSRGKTPQPRYQLWTDLIVSPWEVFQCTWWALQMNFRGNLFSRMELAPWFYGTLCVRNWWWLRICDARPSSNF